MLSAPLPLETDGSTARGEISLRAGERLGFALQAAPTWGDTEPVSSATGEALGNFPQAFSHIGLIDAAGAIHRAEQAANPSV